MKKVFVISSLLLFLGGFVSAQIIVQQGISCPGSKNGRLAIFPTFGTGPYTYDWGSGPSPKNSIEGLGSGLYSVTVKDVFAVSQTFSYNLVDPPAITAAYAIVPNSNWPMPNGRITITPGGGTGWMNYIIIDSTTTVETTQTANVFNNLYSGRYYITLTDLNGCVKHDTVVVTETANINTTFDIDYTACYRSTAPISNIKPVLLPINLPAKVEFPNNTITIVKIIPGARPYITSTVDTLASIDANVNPGRNLFKIVTNDNKGFRYSWVVDSVITPIKITWTQRNISCYGDNNGRITTLAEGSYGVFDYTITGPSGFSSNNASVTNLFAGRYTIHVADSTGCGLDQTVNVIQPDAPIQGQFIKQSPTCFQSNDGKIIANFSGGTGTLSYLWTPGGQTTPTISNLSAGTYSVRVRDINGCTLNPPAVVLTEPVRLKVTDVVVPLTCFDYTNASITTTVVGGNGGNSFTWKKDGIVMNYNTNAITGLSSGVYDLHLKDSVGCVFDTTWTIVDPTKLKFKFANLPISCNDELGTIQVKNLELIPLSVTLGGTTQNVLPGDTTKFFNQTTGNHLVSISNGTCTFDTTVIFTQPDPLIIRTHILDNKCYDGKTGEIGIHVDGGTSGPNSVCYITGKDFRGNNVNQNFLVPSPEFVKSDFTAGLYVISVEDDNGCLAQESVTISQPDPPRAYFSIENTECSECENGKALVRYVDHFLDPLTYLWNTTPVQTTQEVDSLPIGWRYVQITDANGCITTDSVEIMAGNGVGIPNVVTPNGDGHNDVLDVSMLCYNATAIVLIIQNKYGEIVFESTDPSQTIWDAKDKKGNLIHSNNLVYLYLNVIKQDGSEKPYRKTITVLY